MNFFEDFQRVWPLYDNAPAHSTLSVQQFSTKYGMTPVPHPPYSANVTPSDFFLFPWMKKVLKGEQLADVEEVEQKTTEVLKGIKINEFKNCF